MTSPKTETAAPAGPLALWGVLVGIGICWGLSGPLSKLTVSTGNHPLGIVFWNCVIGAAVLTALLALTGRRLPLTRRCLVFFMVCGLLGTALPNTASYAGYHRLPVGVMAIMLALVPMMTLMMALPLGVERPRVGRILGLGLGVAAIAMIVLPDTSLPEPGQAFWVILPLVVTLSYAAENVFIATSRPPALDPLTILCGLSWAALVQITPVTLAAGAWVDLARLGPPELAILANSALHLVAYLGFVWLIGTGGPVFASQVAYVVTGMGVLGGMVFYGERHSPWVWAALAVMFAGIALVRPRR